jgi:uncharacterized protein (TIGR00369 family)
MNPDHIAILDFLKGDRSPSKLIANPFIESLGGELVDADPDKGTVALAFEPGAQFVQGAGVVQGGATSAMLDFALAFAGLTRVPLGTVFGTVSMTVHFMRPVTPGRYIARGKVSRQGSRMIFADAELVKEGQDQAVASATGVMAISSTPAAK